MARNNQYLAKLRLCYLSLLPYNKQVLTRQEIIGLKTTPETLINRGWAVQVGKAQFLIRIPDLDIDDYVERWEEWWIDTTRVSPWRESNIAMYLRYCAEIKRQQEKG